MIPLRGPAEIANRLELPAQGKVLLVEAPAEFGALLAAASTPGPSIQSSPARAIRSVKETFDLILLWQESRIGSRAVFDGALKRLAPEGRLWVVTAMRKVIGPRTQAIHRLELEDLTKAFAKAGMVNDRETRVSAWHMGYRFVKREAGGGRRETGSGKR